MADFRDGFTTGVSNGTSDVTIMGSPISQVRRFIRVLNIHNTDTVSATVTVKYVDNGTERTIVTVTLATGETLIYNDALMLSNTSTLELKLGGVVTTNELTYVTSFEDKIID